VNAPVGVEVERRRHFHGWAFEGCRTIEERLALRHWLKTGEVWPEVSGRDRERIAQFLTDQG
jgi:hypothetical protein